MVRVILTDNPNDRGGRSVAAQADCACDCDCACPVGGEPTPVLSLPVAYYLELTPACQNRCPGCGNVYAADRLSPVIARRTLCAEAIPDVISSPSVPNGPHARASSSSHPMNGDEWRALLARLSPHTHHLKLTGGEPTLHPDFAAIVRAIDGHGIPFALFTNGRWSDPDALLRLLLETPTCDGLLVSLHGPDAPTHEAFSGVPGSFGETAANVRRAAHAGLDVATSLVLTRHNWDRVEETLKVALALGANHVVCNRWIGTSATPVILRRALCAEESLATTPNRPNGRDSLLPLVAQHDNLAPSEAQLKAAISTIESLRAAGQPIRFGNCIPQCFAPSSSTGCTAGSTFATIDPWGRMRPCNHAPWVAGDLRTQAVEAVWQGPVLEAWRALVPAECAECTAYGRCHGGCRAQALLAGRARDPLMGQALAPAPVVEEELRLYGGLRPVGWFVRREEGGREVLIDKSRVVVVPAEWRELWSQLDGSKTLWEIERRYGDCAPIWAGVLHQQGWATWAGS